MYLAAMAEIGAPTEAIESFIGHLRNGSPVEDALHLIRAPQAVCSFVLATLHTACHGPTHEALGSFFFARENAIPQMFQFLLNSWAVDPRTVPMFNYYLQRHIDVDSDSHGPATEAIILETLGDKDGEWIAMLRAGQHAVDSRVRMWDALADKLQAVRGRSVKSRGESSTERLRLSVRHA
jgi:hypothetical protein